MCWRGWLRGLVLSGIVLGCCDRFCLCSGFRGFGVGLEEFSVLVFGVLVVGFGCLVFSCGFVNFAFRCVVGAGPVA